MDAPDHHNRWCNKRICPSQRTCTEAGRRHDAMQVLLPRHCPCRPWSGASPCFACGGQSHRLCNFQGPLPGPCATHSKLNVRNASCFAISIYDTQTQRSPQVIACKQTILHLAQSKLQVTFQPKPTLATQSSTQAHPSKHNRAPNRVK